MSVDYHLLSAQKAFLPEINPLQDEVAISKPVHAARTRIGPPNANHWSFLQPSLAASMRTAPCG